METQTIGVRALAAELVRHHPPVGRLGLRLGDVRVVVRSNDEGLLGDLRGYFAPFVDEGVDARDGGIEIIALDAPAPDLAGLEMQVRLPEPGKKSVKEAFADLADGRIIRKLKTGVVFLIGGDVHLAIGACRRWQNQIVNFVNNRFIEARMREGWLLCHAAAVARGERSLVLAGFSGMGKSTLSLRAMDTPGSIFISNDRVMLEREGDAVIVHGVPKHPRINPGTILHNERLSWLLTPAERAEFAALEGDALWGLEHKYDGLIHRSFGTGKLR
ncbi:MAG: HprK-related kinase B, partial [Myxococcales bacterium]|nr:HprK-related kinase B [Myxococcales bacterium]